ncbi:MAG: hypothetical protein AAF583_13700 [Pseudomonadota bacterium]
MAVLVGLLSQCVLAHGLHRGTEFPRVNSLDDVEQRLSAYRQSGDDALLEGVAAYFRRAVGTDQRERLLRVWHAQAMHRFSEASDLLAPLLAPGTADSWLLAANLNRVIGKFSESELACREAGSSQPLLGQVCLLQTRTHQGRKPTAAALEKLEQLFTLLDERSSIGYERKAWVLGVLANAHSLRGNDSKALMLSRSAFRVGRTVQNRAAYAYRLIADSQYQKALEIIGDRHAAPALVVLRLVALRRLNQLDRQSALVDKVDKQFRHDIAHGDLLHAREMATFYLEVKPDLERARFLAKQNWAVQKELEDRALLERVSATL